MNGGKALSNPLSSLSLTPLVFATIGEYYAFRLCSFLYACWRHSRSPLRILAGPRDETSWTFGHQRKIITGAEMDVQVGCVCEYGETFAMHGEFGVRG